jgi:VWFA-related protein
MRYLLIRAAPYAALVACAACAWAQPPFRHLNVVAFDKSGQPVTDLTDKDFKVTDDGKQQSILSLLLNDNRPAAPAPLGPHEYSNQTGVQPSTTVILFDLLNGTFTDRNFVTSTILRSLQSAENPTSIYLYILTNKATLYPVRGLPKTDAPHVTTDWSNAKTLIENAIDQVFGLRPIDEKLEGNREVLSYKALHDIAGALSVLPGPKSIVWTTQGFPMPVNFGGLCHDVTIDNVKAPCMGTYVDFTPVVHHLAGQLDHAGISIWAVDESDTASGVLSRAMLETFSGMTGGRTYARGQTPAAVTDAFKAMHLNYTLAYRPADSNWNDRFHKVKVTCTRKGVQILAEDGYVAHGEPDTTAELVQSASFATSNIPEISVRATASQGPDPHTVRLHLRMGPSGMLIVPQDNHYTGQLALMLVGLTEKGPVQLTKLNSLKLNFTSQEWEAAKNGLTAAQDVQLPEAVSQVRVVVVDQWAGRVGSLTIPKVW